MIVVLSTSNPPRVNQLSTFIQSSVADRKRALIVGPDYIEFDDKNQRIAPFTKFEKADIAAFRYGLKAIEGYRFVIGRVYFIDIRSRENKTIKLRLKTVYGIRKKELHKKFNDILDHLFEFYIKDIIAVFLDKFDNGEDCALCGIVLTKEGIQLNKKFPLRGWHDIDIRPYYLRLSFYSKKNPENNCIIDYADHWNVDVLYNLVRIIMARKELREQ